MQITGHYVGRRAQVTPAALAEKDSTDRVIRYAGRLSHCHDPSDTYRARTTALLVLQDFEGGTRYDLRTRFLNGDLHFELVCAFLLSGYVHF
eukprot:COSAG02_NODE_22373_length_754_cov_1.809160_2_plen_92_part_00